MEKVIEMKQEQGPSLDTSAIHYRLNLMAIRRSADVGEATIDLFSLDLCSQLDARRYTTADVLSAIDSIAFEERGEGEAAWPEIGKIINRVKLVASKRVTEERRQAAMRGLPTPPPEVEPPDPETKERIDRLNALLKAKTRMA